MESFKDTLKRLRGRTPKRELARQANISAAYIGRLESGERPGNPHVARILDDALKAGGALIASLGRDDEAEQLVESPREIERRRARLRESNVDDAKLTYLENSTAAAIASNESTSPQALAPRVKGLRQHVDTLLRAEQHPSQRARLYQIAAHLSGLLAALALDLGRFASARAYSREAFDLAAASEQAQLQAWARATQSLIEYYGQEYHDALAYAQDGQQRDVGGVHSVRLAVNGEARALARMGDKQGVHDAIGRGMELLSSLPPAIGVSASLTATVYCNARATANAATAYLSVGAPERAAEYAADSLTAFDAAQLHGPQALSRLDLATALVLMDNGDSEAAVDLALQALDLAGRERFESVQQRAREFVTAALAVADTRAVRDLRDRIRDVPRPLESR